MISNLWGGSNLIFTSSANPGTTTIEECGTFLLSDSFIFDWDSSSGIDSSQSTEVASLPVVDDDVVEVKGFSDNGDVVIVGLDRLDSYDFV